MGVNYRVSMQGYVAVHGAVCCRSQPRSCERRPWARSPRERAVQSFYGPVLGPLELLKLRVFLCPVATGFYTAAGGDLTGPGSAFRLAGHSRGRSGLAVLRKTRL